MRRCAVLVAASLLLAPAAKASNDEDAEGPFIRGRIIDLSTAAAGVIGMRSSGVAPVMVERIATN